MDNTLVSARVPRAKKERGASILASLGATTSDLINSAFDYLISAKQLPVSNAPALNKPDERAFANFVRNSTMSIDWPEAFNGNYKELEQQERVKRYESLA